MRSKHDLKVRIANNAWSAQFNVHVDAIFEEPVNDNEVRSFNQPRRNVNVIQWVASISNNSFLPQANKESILQRIRDSRTQW